MSLLHEAPAAVDWSKLKALIEEKYKVDLRDYAGRYSEAGKAKREEYLAEWLKKKGLAGKEYVLDKPTVDGPDWPQDSEEMALRKRINVLRSGADGPKEVPYLDFWHWMSDDIANGGYSYLALEEEDLLDNPKWVNEILAFILEEVRDSPAYDGEFLTLFVSW